MPPPLAIGSAWHPRLALALSHHLAGNRLDARAHADTLRSLAEAQLRTRAPDASGDPLARNSAPLAYHAIALALLGDRGGAVREARAAVGAYNETIDALEGVTIRELASIAYIISGDHQRAIAELERIVTEPSAHYAPRLSMNPVFALLEDSPRYRILTASVPD